MAVVIKSRYDIERMRRAGHLGYEVLGKMRQAAVAGVSTKFLDELARDELKKAGGKALSKNYPTYKPGQGFPGHTCISINEEVVHGVPGTRTLKEGDIVTLDLALSLDGYCADTAVTVAIGEISPALQKLLDVTKETLDLAFANMRPGRLWSDIARLLQYHVERNGYNVVREFVGHGIGREMHEDPKVPNFVTGEQLGTDFTLRKGMTLAVEPMVVMGRRDVNVYKDGWTAYTIDRMAAAHFEHTVAITDTGVDLLTDGHIPEAVSVTTAAPAIAPAVSAPAVASVG